MKVRALEDHRFGGEEKSKGDIYELTPERAAQRAIAEGWVEEVGAKKAVGATK